MDTERNRESFMQALDRLNRGDLEGAVAFLAPDVVLHERIPGLPPGRQGVKLHLQSWLQAIPDAQISLHDLIAAEEKVVGRLQWTGTHAGDLLGRPPTGRRVSGGAVLITRWVAGKAVEIWLSTDLTTPLRRSDVSDIE